jgi:pseudomonalisin
VLQPGLYELIPGTDSGGRSHNNALGFAAPWIYSLAQRSGASAFYDVTSGTNGYYSATTGWDYATGWGSFNVATVSKAVTARTGAISALLDYLLH